MIVEEHIKRADRILQECKGLDGVRASAMASANYDCYFTRDSVINALGLSLTGDDMLLDDLRIQLEQLKFLQGTQGQIASNFKASPYNGIEVSFGTITPKLDGPSWFVLAVCHLIEKGLIGKNAWHESLLKSLSILDALDYNDDGLIYCPIGTDWADEYICEGYVLHIQILRAWAQNRFGVLFNDKDAVEKSEKIKAKIDHLFSSPKSEVEGGEYLISSFSNSKRVTQFDFVSNVLYAHLYADSELSKSILDIIRSRFLDKGILPPAFDPQITEADELWNTLRDFHLFEFKNMPGHYHNGGAWWIWIGWYALVLVEHDRKEDLTLLKTLVNAFFGNREEFEFCEYVTPNGEEGGQNLMAFTASGLRMLHTLFTRHDG